MIAMSKNKNHAIFASLGILLLTIFGLSDVHANNPLTNLFKENGLEFGGWINARHYL